MKAIVRRKKTAVPRVSKTEGLLAHAKQRAADARQRAFKAIDKLVAEGGAVTFPNVATTAGVTKAYLYAQPALRERIAAIRAAQQGHGDTRLRLVTAGASPAVSRGGRSEGAKEILLAAKEQRIRELEAENVRLKADLKIALGKLYERT